MTFQPGHTLSPGRRHGSRNKRTAEIFNRLENRGDLDPADLLSSIVTNNQEPKELRIQAAGLLMPYKYSKCGTAPVQVYIDSPLDTPEFTHLSDAEQFLAKVAALVAHGQLDFQAGQNLSALAKNWIDTQYQREELNYKISPPETRDATLRITGGLPALPGTNITMPVINGHAVSEGLLTPPTDVVPSNVARASHLPPTDVVPSNQPRAAGLPPLPNEFNQPTPGEAKAQGPHPLQKHHFAESASQDAEPRPADQPGINSTTTGEGGQVAQNGPPETQDQEP